MTTKRTKCIATAPGEPSLHVELTAQENKDRVAEIKVAKEKKKANAYKVARSQEYPPLPDQLDMLYKDNINGTTLWVDLITSIKNKYPKPGN